MFSATKATCASTNVLMPIASRSRASIASRRAMKVIVRAEKNAERVTKASEELAEKFTVGGGGDDGFCDYNDVKEAIKECEGLEGAKLEACYASYGCNVESVTDHYAKAAGIEKKTEGKK